MVLVDTSVWVSAEGLAEHGTDFFANYLSNPQSKLLRLIGK